MSENGQVDTEVAERAIEAVAEQAVAKPVDERPWLHPDALKPRDYLRGAVALKEQLAERKFDSCYDFLGTHEMYPFVMWALRSREDPSFTWDDALDTPFYLFRMGDDARPQILPSEPLGRSESPQNGTGSTRRRPKPVAVPASASSSGSPGPSTTS